MIDLKKVEQVVQDIKDIKIQWATNIAKAAFEIIFKELKSQKFESFIEAYEFTKTSMKILEDARPTEPMLFNWMSYIYAKIQPEIEKADLKSFLKTAIDASETYFNMITDTAEKAIQNGVWIINYWDAVFTYCHSGSAIETILANKRNWIDFVVYNWETRPLYQWHKTAMDFLNAGVKVTMVTDNAAPFIIDDSDPMWLDINCIVIGCDALKLNWSVINKVWSFWICSTAFHSKIPVYIAWNLLKTDIHDDIRIETRNPQEVWPDKPEELEIINFAFDQIPAKYITWIITEFWIIKPSELKETVKKHYPWMAESKPREERR